MTEKVKDLVCGMEIDRDSAAATYEYKGKTYYFCNPGCRDTFARDPEKYVPQEEG
jgi:Cu+-exporting ATPase